MEDSVYGMRCPFRFEKYIDKREEMCRKDCAWLMRDQEGHAACAIPWFVSGSVSGLISYMEVEIEEEDE